MPEQTDKLPLTEQELGEWWSRIKDARALRKNAEKWWEANLKAYAPAIADNAESYAEGRVSTNRDFTLVERKKPELFFQSPDITAIPSPLFQGMEPLLTTHTSILNELLGRDGVDAKAMVHQVLFDVLCPAGTGWTKIGYEQATQVIDQPMTDEMGQPMTDEEGQPVMQQVPVPVYSRCYWKPFSPKQALIPADATSTRCDEWPWVGWEFELPIRTAKRLGWVPADFEGTDRDKTLRFNDANISSVEKVVHVAEIYYQSAIFRDDIVHPLHITHLVLIEGLKDHVAAHGDDPDQDWTDTNEMGPTSRVGFPIHPLTIRTVSDSPYVQSDCTQSRPTVNELDTFRSQMVQQRDATIARFTYDASQMTTEALEKIVRSPVGGMIGLPTSVFQSDGIKPLPQGAYPRENFAFNDYLDNDLARTHGFDANQSGTQSEGDTTATEASIQQANANARLSFERGIVLDWYIRGVTKFSSCVQRYLDPARAAQIVGIQQAQAWEGWRKTIPAALAFTALPDSTQRMDLATDRKRVLDAYTFFANDPYCNRSMFLQQVVAPRLGFPAECFSAQPPPKQPEPAKPGFSFKGEDLNPLAPQFAIVMEILKQSGVVVPPAAIIEAQGAAQNALIAQQAAVASQTEPGGPEGEGETEHPGMVAPLESLSKHANALTGGMQGTGEPIGGGIQ